MSDSGKGSHAAAVEFWLELQSSVGLTKTRGFLPRRSYSWQVGTDYWSPAWFSTCDTFPVCLHVLTA